MGEPCIVLWRRGQPKPGLTGSTMKHTDAFVPFAFGVGVAVGDESEDFLSEAAKVAEHCRRFEPELHIIYYVAA